MARSESGRIVIEVDHNLKQQLYAALDTSQKTLKDWFVEEAQNYLKEQEQPNLFTKKPPND